MKFLVISAIAVAPHVTPHVAPHVAPAPARVAPRPAVVPAPTPRTPVVVVPVHNTPKCDDKKEKCK
jgi:hypothetical protein